MNSYQMVLHRPVETAGVIGNFICPGPQTETLPSCGRSCASGPGGILSDWPSPSCLPGAREPQSTTGTADQVLEALIMQSSKPTLSGEELTELLRQLPEWA